VTFLHRCPCPPATQLSSADGDAFLIALFRNNSGHFENVDSIFPLPYEKEGTVPM
jgi:hypothetical protein